MKFHSIMLCLLSSLLLASCATPTAVQKDEAASLDPLMGDWEGHRVLSSGAVVPVAVKMIALGDATYQGVVVEPSGERSLREKPVEIRLEGDRLLSASTPAAVVTVRDNVISASGVSEKVSSLQLRKVINHSPTLGAKPPAGATVLFDGTSLEAWNGIVGSEGKPPVEVPTASWRLVDGKAMEVVAGTGSIVTKKKFKDFRLHLEFRTPFMPKERGQGRGNSGVYLQGRYEVQVLDSYGLTGEDNECGGIYKVAKPRINMCAPPGQWQTYDITFFAPRFDASGAKMKDASVTILHNGVAIHENLTIPGPTGGALDATVQLPGGLYLQDHGNPVQYRNIWVAESQE